MKLKSLFLLMITAAVCGAGYFYSLNQNQTSANESLDLIPDLIANMNSITKFTVKESGDVLLSSVSKSENGWVVDDRAGYEANVRVVRKVFNALAEAKLVEAKTSNPENYTKLGVEEVKKEDAQGVLLTVEGLSNSVNIIFGNDGSSGKNTQYVRMMGEEQSWLINKKINFRRDTTEWLQKDLLDIPPERIKTVEIKHPDGIVVNIANTGNAAYEFELDAVIPADKKLSESEIYQVANALSSLQLRDVAAFDTLSKDAIQPIVTTFKTYDGLTIVTTAYGLENAVDVEPYFTIDIAFNAADVDESLINKAKESAKENAKESNSEVVLDAAMVSDPKAAEAFANKVQPKLSGWGYLFPTITRDALTKKLEYFFIESGS